MKCLNCEKPVPQVEGKRKRLYCDDACKKAYSRKLAGKKVMPETEFDYGGIPEQKKVKNPHNYSEIRANRKSGYVYIIQSGDSDYYKIGQTVNRPIARLRDLQTGSPVELKLYEVFFVSDTDYAERAAHVLVEGKWVRGEWFKLNQGDLDRLDMLLVDDATLVYFSEKELFYAKQAGRRCSDELGSYEYGDVLPRSCLA